MLECTAHLLGNLVGYMVNIVILRCLVTSRDGVVAMPFALQLLCAVRSGLTPFSTRHLIYLPPQPLRLGSATREGYSLPVNTAPDLWERRLQTIEKKHWDRKYP